MIKGASIMLVWTGMCNIDRLQLYCSYSQGRVVCHGVFFRCGVNSVFFWRGTRERKLWHSAYHGERVRAEL